uniref:phospholipase D n=4 Tax=Hirondellea gigas TaxID=1518452 RepID=A0A6A7FUJ6_9CRUS
MVFLQGKLEVVVQEARNLPNLDFSKRKRDDLSDPYVNVKIIGKNKKEKKIGKTHVIDDCLNPKWYYFIVIQINQDVEEIQFIVKDKDKLKSDKIGFCSVPVFVFNNTRGYEGEMDLTNKKGGLAGSLLFKIQFTGTSDGDKHAASSYFPIKIKGCSRREHKSDSTDSGHTSFIHGKMLIHIKSAENLPNLDMTLLNQGNKSDPFVTVSLIDADNKEWKVATTKTIDDCLDPVWNEIFPINVCHEITGIIFKVYDQDLVAHDKMASMIIPAATFDKVSLVSGSFPLKKKNKECGKLNISIDFEKITRQSYEVPDCIYPSRPGNKVTLYQDAHCPKLPKVVHNSLGAEAVPHNAWEEIMNTMENAKKFIYITGWSVKTSISLVRDEHGDGKTIGQLLFNKANEGVDIRLLLWDELTSTESKQMGAMSTYDNVTKDYFKNSPVKVVLAVRNKTPKGLMPDSSYFTKFCYSHHQKTILVDAEIEFPGRQNARKLVAYIGGLDLTAGRYDTPEHPLFSTLSTLHKDDFYNNLVSTNAHSGPRQPWHDIHSQVIGPAAIDILNNFTERWKKQGIAGDTIFNFEDLNKNYSYNGQDSWNVQIFRSISEDSVQFEEVTPESVMKKKGRIIDSSIQHAYIHQIQKAERFIYIENQYFLGSSHQWENCRDIPVKNLVPLEIAAKIVDKIRQGEHFVAYILIPMFPEGNPDDVVTQEILHWQFHTIEMMYSLIGKEITKKGIDAEPQDYLLFFCVAKREDAESVSDNLKQPLDETAALAFRNRRSMIYVHSKMAIFDDKFILVGTANINDRSLGGTRDTEIAMGAYQPTIGSRANGDVSTFRKCLWSEHLGVVAPLDLDPGSKKCAKTVRKLAEDALLHYMDVNLPLPLSHLLIYPLDVQRNGVVSSRNDFKMFPDSKASVVGMRSKVIPTELTT